MPLPGMSPRFHGAFGIERAALLGLARQQRREIGVGELFGVARKKGKELHRNLLMLAVGMAEIFASAGQTVQD
ncbi:hypothetical protein [Mesorhizobium sp. M0500]|uniref:hypothetical protein n=1 Tax=Mesorhizobium sp. M0500 TaxID=2956953 RepID=UPI00333C7464